MSGTPPPAVPEVLRRFVALVDGGEYWESHEVLEQAWRRNRSPFYQGLILYASAFVHAGRANAHGVDAQLAKAEARLAPYDDGGPGYLGLDVRALLGHAAECRRAVAEHPGAWGARLRAPRLEIDPARVRGTEPELGA